MATTHLQGNDIPTSGELPAVGSPAPAFEVTGADLAPITLEQFAGSRLVLNIFPSVDTGVCAQSVRRFNEEAGKLENAKVLCVSRDLPFALARFCGAEGLENVLVGSDFRHGFGEAYGVIQAGGPLAHLLARSVVVVDETGKVVHSQLVDEITTEPDYEAALASLQ